MDRTVSDWNPQDRDNHQGLLVTLRVVDGDTLRVLSGETGQAAESLGRNS